MKFGNKGKEKSRGSTANSKCCDTPYVITLIDSKDVSIKCQNCGKIIK